MTLAGRGGLPIDPPRRNVNSRLSLEIGELVRAERGDAAANWFHRRVSRAFFAEHADIADVATLTTFAADAGVAHQRVAEAWQRRTYHADVDRAVADSLRRGVRGVPAYGFASGAIMSGMAEPADIVRTFRRAANGSRF